MTLSSCGPTGPHQPTVKGLSSALNVSDDQRQLNIVQNQEIIKRYINIFKKQLSLI